MQYILRSKNPNYNGRTYGIKFADGVAIVTEHTPIYWATNLSPTQAVKRIMIDMRDSVDIQVLEAMSQEEWDLASVPQEKQIKERIEIGPEGVTVFISEEGSDEEIAVDALAPTNED